VSTGQGRKMSAPHCRARSFSTPQYCVVIPTMKIVAPAFCHPNPADRFPAPPMGPREQFVEKHQVWAVRLAGGNGLVGGRDLADIEVPELAQLVRENPPVVLAIVGDENFQRHAFCAFGLMEFREPLHCDEHGPSSLESQELDRTGQMLGRLLCGNH
jgi:hypothetical protein